MADLPPHLSASSADTYDDCPAKWKAKYVDRVKDPAGEEAEIGTLSHSVLEALYHLPAAERTVEAAKGLLGVVAADEPTDRRRMAWGYVVTAMKMENPTNVRVLGNEVKLEGVEIAGVPFKGVVDRAEEDIFGEVRISDYKTGKRPNPRFLLPKERQVTLYALGWEAIGSGRADSGALIWLKAKKVDEVNLDVLREPTQVWFSDIWAGIKRDTAADSFAKDPGPLCGWCPVLSSCEEGMAMVRERISEGKNVGPGIEVIATRDLEASVGLGLRVVEESAP